MDLRISTRVLESFADYHEVNIFLRGMVPLVGFPHDVVTYERHERLAGESHYPLSKMLALAFDGITSLSNKPIRIITGAGIVVSLIGFIGVIWAIVQAILGSSVAGWASIVCIVCFMGGVQLVCLGVIGEYIGKIYMETKARPRYIISERTWAPDGGTEGCSLKLPGFKKKERIPLNYIDQGSNLREITFKPYYDKYIMSFVIEDMAAPFYPDMPYMAGLDLGTDNIAAIACTDGTSVVYKGGAVLSENQFFAKQRAQAVSIITRGHEHKHADSAYLEALSREHDCFLKDQMHKISTDIIRYCVDHRVGILVIGVNKLWKQNTNMGKKNNQKFVSIPHYRLRQMIEYKALRAGIDVVEQEESYTSKADVTASDFMPVYGKVKARPVFSGRRIERGMYLCRDGYCINADCNGAANILRKAVPDAWKGFKDFHFLATPASRGFHQLNPAGRNNSHKQHPDWKILSPAV